MSVSARRSTRRGLVAAAVLASLAVVASACGGGSEAATATTAAPTTPTTTAEAATTTSAPPTTTTTEPPTDEELILEAAENFWFAYLAANTDPSDVMHPDLMRWASGPALIRVQETIRERQAAGLAVKLPEGAPWEVTAEITEYDPGAARVQACLLDGAVQYVVATGEVIEPGQASLATEMRVREIAPGRWEVTFNGFVSEVPGAAGCGS